MPVSSTGVGMPCDPVNTDPIQILTFEPVSFQGVTSVDHRQFASLLMA